MGSFMIKDNNKTDLFPALLHLCLENDIIGHWCIRKSNAYV